MQKSSVPRQHPQRQKTHQRRQDMACFYELRDEKMLSRSERRIFGLLWFALVALVCFGGSLANVRRRVVHVQYLGYLLRRYSWMDGEIVGKGRVLGRRWAPLAPLFSLLGAVDKLFKNSICWFNLRSCLYGVGWLWWMLCLISTMLF
jgi:hypothetical protein